MDAKEVGLIIATRRERLKISQTQLSKAVGVSRPYISQIENGSKKVGETTLLKVMSALGLSYQDFFTEDQLAGATPEERAILEGSMPFIQKLGEYLTRDQFEDVMQALQKTQEANAAVQSYLKSEPMPSGPDGWLALSDEDRRLVQRIVSRLNKQ